MLKNALLASAMLAFGFVGFVGAASAETTLYTDQAGNRWVIEGPAVGTWRPFPDAAAHCPSLHIRAEPTQLGKGANWNKQQWAEAKARSVQTMHMVCVTEPDAPAPARAKRAAPNAQPLLPVDNTDSQDL